MTNKTSIKIIINAYDNAFIPQYKHIGDAGADVKAFRIETAGQDNDTRDIDFEKNGYMLPPKCAVLVGCGFKCQLPSEYAFLVCPRSGLAKKNYITVLNAPGICDSGYQGEYGVILYNAGAFPFWIHYGDRIAQLVLTNTPKAEFITGEFKSSDRGAAGFGSSGVGSDNTKINETMQQVVDSYSKIYDTIKTISLEAVNTLKEKTDKIFK